MHAPILFPQNSLECLNFLSPALPCVKQSGVWGEGTAAWGCLKPFCPGSRAANRGADSGLLDLGWMPPHAVVFRILLLSMLFGLCVQRACLSGVSTCTRMSPIPQASRGSRLPSFKLIPPFLSDDGPPSAKFLLLIFRHMDVCGQVVFLCLWQKNQHLPCSRMSASGAASKNHAFLKKFFFLF